MLFLDKGSMERSPMWFDSKGEGRETPGVTDQGKIMEGGLGDQSEGNLVVVCMI